VRLCCCHRTGLAILISENRTQEGGGSPSSRAKKGVTLGIHGQALTSTRLTPASRKGLLTVTLPGDRGGSKGGKENFGQSRMICVTFSNTASRRALDYFLLLDFDCAGGGRPTFFAGIGQVAQVRIV